MHPIRLGSKKSGVFFGIESNWGSFMTEAREGGLLS